VPDVPPPPNGGCGLRPTVSLEETWRTGTS
jgi:hypothetical protein